MKGRQKQNAKWGDNKTKENVKRKHATSKYASKESGAAQSFKIMKMFDSK